MTLRAPFQPMPPSDDVTSRRSWSELLRLLNRPHRNEYTVAVPCEDALVLGHGPFATFPTQVYGASAIDMTVGQVAQAAHVVDLTVGTGSIKAIPFMVNHTWDLTSLSINVTTGVATSKARVAIYDSVDDDGGDYNPHERIVGSDEFDCSTTGVKAYATSISLRPGRVYHAAFLGYTAAPKVGSVPVGAIGSMGQTSGFAPITHVTVAYASGATGFPAFFPTGNVIALTAIPAICLTFSATSAHTASIIRCGPGPELDGTVLRRVRLVKASSLGRTDSTKPSVVVKAMVSGAVVGTYDSTMNALGANEPRHLTDSDVDRPIPAGSVLQVEVSQRGWPKITMRDASVLFDLGVT